MSDQRKKSKREAKGLGERSRSSSSSSSSSSDDEGKTGHKSATRKSKSKSRPNQAGDCVKPNGVSEKDVKEKQANGNSSNHQRDTSTDSDARKVKGYNNNQRSETRSANRSRYAYNSSPRRHNGTRSRANYHSSSSGSSNNNNGIRSRPVTSHARLESIYASRGYDNSERNPNRVNLGSSTDRVADERPIFGSWRAPDPERQRQLVERLAPARPPAPPDPKFNHWKNHFQYYWMIGVDQKPRRQGNYQDSPRVGYNENESRLLSRPQTTSGRTMLDNSNNINNDYNDNPLIGSASVGRRPITLTRGSQSARDYNESSNSKVVAGLDRRYMGLQAVSGTEMTDIVQRLTKMTSAYNAKFAPNPHVWVDKEPGAHMVKRTNTTVG